MKIDRYKLLLAAVVILYVVVFFWLNMARYRALFSFEWEDEAIENQIAWNTAHGRFFYQSIDDGLFAGHFTPFHATIALFHLLYPHIVTWYFLSILAVALTSFVIYALSLEVLKDKLQSFFVALLFLFYPPLHYLNLGPIDTVIFTMPLVTLAYFCFIRNKFVAFILLLLLCLSCKESMVFLVFMFSIAALFCRKDKKWFFAPLFMAGLWFFITIIFIFPHISDVHYMDKSNNFAFYSDDWGTLKMIIKFFCFSPLKAIAYMLSPEHFPLIVKLFIPVLFLPIFSTVTLIGLSGFLQLMLTKGPLGLAQSYYLANVAPFIFIGFIYGLRRLSHLLSGLSVLRITQKTTAYVLIVGSFLSSILVIFGGNIYGTIHSDEIHDKRFMNIKNIYNSKFYTMDEGDKVAWSLIKMIPPHASVSASGDLLIPLSHREKLVEFGPTEFTQDYFNVDYILINKKNMYFGAGHYARPKESDFIKLESLVRQGNFVLVAGKESYFLYKRVKK